MWMYIKKIIVLFFLSLVIISPILNTTYAETNSEYLKGQTQNNSAKDPEGGFADWITDKLLGAIGKALACIGWLLEKIVAAAVGMLTGSDKVFPWADRVIFNTMPILDVNFINPAKGSLWESSSGTTAIGNAIRNLYFTGLSIGLGFFGIMVSVMAIKLALSTIASEKAKCKEAIVNWATALVLLFGLHYLISFTFYLNEQLVTVASSILTNNSGSTTTNGAAINALQSSSSNTQSFSSMGEKFKDKAFDSNWDTESFTYAVLYLMFIILSLNFFFAYIKRLFGVVILAVIGPFAVAYDFLKKNIG